MLDVLKINVGTYANKYVVPVIVNVCIMRCNNLTQIK